MADSTTIDWETIDVDSKPLCRIDNPACESCGG